MKVAREAKATAASLEAAATASDAEVLEGMESPVLDVPEVPTPAELLRDFLNFVPWEGGKSVAFLDTIVQTLDGNDVTVVAHLFGAVFQSVCCWRYMW